tara:strand:+ start:1656 stop:2240 length:585 start_codon:yes stop_codon:yes gene_type:complete
MAEVEYKGIKIGGSKMLLILPLLGTIIGGLWGGFELWHRYQAMEIKIAKYVAPDLSEFDKRIAIIEKAFAKEMKALKTEVSIIKDSVIVSTDYTRDIKNDLKSDIQTLERTVDDIERRGKDSFKLVRDSIDTNDTKVRTMITVNSDRFDNRREQIRNDMDALETRINDSLAALKKEIDDKIKNALENPLANMRK